MENSNRILIGIPTGETPRFNDFQDFLEILEKPEGTLISKCHSQSPARNRNLLIDEALKYNCTHLLFIDDDMVPPANALTRLMEHDKDIVSGLYYMRTFPHQPVAFDKVYDDGRCVHISLNGHQGLIKVSACGFGFLLLKTRIFKVLSKPYVTLGHIEPDQWCDDIAFCKKLREADFEIFCDTNCPIGHHLNSIIWPTKIDNKWGVAIDTGGRDVISYKTE